MKSLLVCCIVLLSFSDTVAQKRTDRSSPDVLLSAVAHRTDSLHSVSVKRWPNRWSVRDYNRWRVHYGRDAVSEITFLKLIGFEEQIPATRKRQRKFRRLQRGAQIVTSVSLVLLGGAVLDDDSRHARLYAGTGAALATGSALGLILGAKHLRKQGLSPAEIQALIDQYNREVLKDLD